MADVAVLFVAKQSIYKLPPLRGRVDAWDENRDARRFRGGMPVIAHPPCRLWSELSHMSTAPSEEKQLAIFALDRVRMCGGVLEHPYKSKLWKYCGLPLPGSGQDEWGGFTIEVDQFHWGHKARKRTWLYIAGIGPGDVPVMPKRAGEPTHVVTTSNGNTKKPEVQRWERSATPPYFATWLYELAVKCRKAHGCDQRQS